jgi:hypothetical protein
VLLALLMFGVEPAMQLTRTSTRATLAQGAPAVLPGGRRHGMLIRIQVAAAFGLLMAASVTVSYGLRLSRDDSGIDLDRLAIGTVVFPREQFDDAGRREAIDAVLTALRASPGVERADAATGMPFGLITTPLAWLSDPARVVPAEHVMFELGSTPGYLHTIGVPLEYGRLFNASDTQDAPAVAVLSAAAARRVFGTTDVLGRTVSTRGMSSTPVTTTRRVVGIAADTDVQYRGRRTSELLYVPLAQTSVPVATFAARSENVESAANAIRLAASHAVPGAAALGVGPGVEMLAPGLSISRVASTATLTLGVTALLLSMVGLHGVLTQLLSRRTREMALRLALGARPRQVWWLSVREGLKPVLGGLAMGMAIGAAARMLLISQLDLQTPGLDVAAFVIVPTSFVAVALAACAAPATRASRVVPSVALRDV